jgi:pimeloyl-ACP methyl ester carboxylesterase
MPKTTPEDVDTGMEQSRSADGTIIGFERTGSGSPLVLSHGTGLDYNFWDLSDVCSALAEHYTVYVIDRRGRGGSGDAFLFEFARLPAFISLERHNDS